MIEYRLAEPTDAIAIAALHADSWQRHYRGVFEDEYLDDEVHVERKKVWLERFALADRPHIVVAEEEGLLVGFVCTFPFYNDTWGHYLDNLHVRYTHKGSGIGRSLMRHVALYVGQLKPLMPIYLWVLESNTPAIHAYDALKGKNDGLHEISRHVGVMPQSLKAFRYVWEDPNILI